MKLDQEPEKRNRSALPILLVCLWALLPTSWAQSGVRMWEEDIIMPDYRLDPADKNPMFYRQESYQGAQKRVYPYPFQVHVTNIKQKKSYRFLFLENDYIKLSILPEIGGRLFSATDKTNGYEIFYRQHVIKPALIGMLGAWISGGIEWCVFHHHRNTTHMPVDYTLVANSDGSKTIWFGETERRHRMKWLIGITLFPDKSYIEATVRLYNRTPIPHSMLYWANVAVHVNDDYQVIFPPSVQVVTYHAKNDFLHWPLAQGFYRGIDYTGVDLSWWRNHPEPVSFFAWDLQEDFMGGYDHGQQAGVVHVGNHHIVSGAKLWEWSPGPRGKMWDKILTDMDGPYAELMVGAYSDNQPDYSWIKPYEVRTFKQYWYPIREIGGFKKANLEAAANLEVKGNEIGFGFNTTSRHQRAKARLRAGSRVLVEEEFSIGPGHPYSRSLPLPERTVQTDLQLTLLDAENRELISYRPTTEPNGDRSDLALPERVQPPPDPVEIETTEELYLTGLRIQQIYNPSVDPDAYYQEALRRDSNDTRTNTIVGINLYQRGLYHEAEKHLRRAIVRLSAEYTRPIVTDPYYQLGLVLRAQGRHGEASKEFYRASWDQAFSAASFFQLAQLSCKRGDYLTALEQIDRSLAINADNTMARNVQAIILRKLGRLEEARKVAGFVVEVDPLDFLARNEIVLLSGESAPSGGKREALSKLMREDVQSYLELACDYSRLGLIDEAIDILSRPAVLRQRAGHTHAMVYYYLGYYSQLQGEQGRAQAYYKQASEASPDYVYPFRLESIDVLTAANAANPEDGRSLYYLGNLLYEHQPDEAIRAWERSRLLEPEFALTHRNLGWAYYYFEKDVPKAISSYELAVRYDPRDPRLFDELDRMYEAGNVDPQKRHAVLSRNHEVVVRTNYSFLREIMVQVLLGEYDQAISHLSDNYFHVREGGGEIHDVFVDAHLLRGLKAMERKDHEAALRDFRRAAEYPENLSVGIPRRDRRAPQVAFLTAEALIGLGKEDEATKLYEKAAGQQQTEGWPETRYYQARALDRLSNREVASKIYQELIDEGRRRLESIQDVDFFAKFGEQETEGARQSMAHYLMGLGYQGLQETALAEHAFSESVKLNASNVWARYYAHD